MKGTLSVLGIAVLCFLIGVGASALLSTDAQAGSIIPSPDRCESICGYKILCGSHPSCTPGIESMHYRCKQWWPALADCDGAWTCGCVALGCGPNCNIE